MVLILFGYTEHVARVRIKKGNLDFKFPTAVNINKCLTQIKLPSSFYLCVPISELPSHVLYKGFSSSIQIAGL